MGKKRLPGKNDAISIGSSGPDIVDRSMPTAPLSIQLEGHWAAMEVLQLPQGQELEQQVVPQAEDVLRVQHVQPDVGERQALRAQRVAGRFLGHRRTLSWHERRAPRRRLVRWRRRT